MAYFAGNAVYIRGAQRLGGPLDLQAKRADLNVVIEGCTFSRNMGMVSAEGAAVHIDGH